MGYLLFEISNKVLPLRQKSEKGNEILHFYKVTYAVPVMTWNTLDSLRSYNYGCVVHRGRYLHYNYINAVRLTIS